MGLARALTPRELEIVRLFAELDTRGEVAARLGISANTVHNHLRSAYRKLGVNSQAGLRAYLGEGL